MSHPRWPGPSLVDLVRLARSLAMGRVEAADDARRGAARRPTTCRATGGCEGVRSSSSQLLVGHVYRWLTRASTTARSAAEGVGAGHTCEIAAQIRGTEGRTGSRASATRATQRQLERKGRAYIALAATIANQRAEQCRQGAGVSLTNRTTRIRFCSIPNFTGWSLAAKKRCSASAH